MKYHTIRLNDTIRDVTEIMNKKKIDFCVCKDNKNRLIGIFTLFILNVYQVKIFKKISKVG